MKAVDVVQQDLRSDGCPCGNRDCPYLDDMFEQHCSAELSNGDPKVSICTDYRPALKAAKGE